MKSAYIYPITARDKSNLTNPYLQDFMESLGEIDFVNRNSPSKRGVFDILSYRKKVDVVFFNWIENLPDKKFGVIQAIILFVLIFLLKSRKVLIVWTMHNKISNAKSKIFYKRVILNFFLNNSDIVLTHSKEGVKYAKDLIGEDYSEKILFKHHPIKNNLSNHTNQIEKKIDILIWGSIYPYKGVDKFLTLLHEKSLQKKYTITISGKIMNDDLREKINHLKTDNITIIDRFVSDNELQNLIESAKLVLFSYNSTGVLSSGALIDTISFGALALGPDKAAFHDLMEENVTVTYSDWDDMFVKIEQVLNGNLQIHPKHIISFINNNSWRIFGSQLYLDIIDKLERKN